MLNRSFPTLDEGLSYVENLIREGVQFETSRVYADRIRPPKKNRHLMVLGVDKKCHKVCTKLAPDGMWNIEVEAPYTPYEKLALWEGFQTVHTQAHRASAWYSRYLPYAVAMLKSEYHFPYLGINYESINSYYGTCLGFVDLGRGGSDADNWHRIEQRDVELYNECYDHSMQVKSPDLPFYEALQPAICFVAVQKPHLLAKMVDKDCWWWDHACKVLESMKRPRPKYQKTLDHVCVIEYNNENNQQANMERSTLLASFIANALNHYVRTEKGRSEWETISPLMPSNQKNP
jgi:hypothetical protein